ncbi:MAG TPA: hypothetical protein VJ840_18825 [Gemmatimonadaceae bacterium]|nr:hypothetical protein [Gemmatimonadaceae bacterium]
MLKRLYLRFRQPKVFLIALLAFIGTMLVAHFFRGVDSDWGATNLTLSCEASVASAVLTVAAEETLELLKTILGIVQDVHLVVKVLREMDADMSKILKGVLLIAEAQREVLIDHKTILETVRDNDKLIIELLKEKQ